MVIFHSYVSLPEGRSPWSSLKLQVSGNSSCDLKTLSLGRLGGVWIFAATELRCQQHPERLQHSIDAGSWGGPDRIFMGFSWIVSWILCRWSRVDLMFVSCILYPIVDTSTWYYSYSPMNIYEHLWTSVNTYEHLWSILHLILWPWTWWKTCLRRRATWMSPDCCWTKALCPGARCETRWLWAKKTPKYW